LLKYKDFLIKLLPLSNPIIYYDRDVNDDGDNGSENYDNNDDSAVAGFDTGFIGSILS